MNTSKLNEFWNHSINPITGLSTKRTQAKRKPVKLYITDRRDQASTFRPRGFE